MSEQDYDWWVDISSGYNLDKFHDEMASKIIWGPSQEIRVWGLDTEIGTECKLTTNEEFGQWMNSMLDDKLVEFGVEVIYKKGYEPIEGIANPVDSAIQGVSGVVTADPIDQSSAQVLSAMISAEVSSPGHEEGTGDTSSHPQNAEEANAVVDWSKLAILVEPEQDCDVNYCWMRIKFLRPWASKQQIREQQLLQQLWKKLQFLLFQPRFSKTC